MQRIAAACFWCLPSSLPTILLNVNQLGQCKGLTLCLRVIIIYIYISFFFHLIDLPWSAVVLLGRLSLLVRDWPVGIIKSMSACLREALLKEEVVKRPSLSLLASWTWLTFHLGSSWSREIFNWMESLEVFWREQRRYCLLKTKQVWGERGRRGAFAWPSKPNW